jgi:hypothetical protein
MEIYFSQSWSLINLRSSHQPAELVFWKCSQVASSHSNLNDRGKKEVSFIRTLTLFVRAPPSWPNPLPKASPPKYYHLGILWIWGRHSQSIVVIWACSVIWLVLAIQSLPSCPEQGRSVEWTLSCPQSRSWESTALSKNLVYTQLPS